jgi:hypothetical protein
MGIDMVCGSVSEQLADGEICLARLNEGRVYHHAVEIERPER